MADEKWQRVREIFDSAIRRTPGEREAFVSGACGGDEELLSEVGSLLSAHDSAEGFMEAPAVERVAEAFTSDGNKLEKGRSLGHYTIIKELGSGGMGEVYLAKDQKLDRHVAIKVLNDKFSDDESNLDRFVREAKAASALNHPNILVIHEIGEADEAHYIVSEYVEGDTLRTVCKEKPLGLSEILDISMQVAGALATAHKAHLIHRDIKPENIMVRPDGYVKILDFGLAKLIEQKNRSFLGLEEPTAIQNQTAKGLILGTVNYMSPEQAKGEETDERSDIFSFGVVIYEMIAGRTPFAGDSMSETFANLINAQPSPLSRFSPNVPAELQRIVSKMLRKNKDERFQTMKGLLTDLRDLRDNITSEERLERTASSEGEKPTGALHATTAEAQHLTAETDYSFLRRIKRYKSLVAVVLAVLLVGAFSLTYWFYANHPASAETNNVSELPRIYWEMTESEKLVFIGERAQYVNRLIADDESELDEGALNAIKIEIGWYVSRRDNLSQEPFKEGLRLIYGRASQYAPLITNIFEERNVPPAVGIYQAMIESEFRDCLVNQLGNSGIFQFTPRTAAIYGLTPDERCNVEKQADASARFMSDLLSDFGETRATWTLALLSFNEGGDGTREQLRELRGRGITGRSFWTILRNNQMLESGISDSSKVYLPRFFAAAIIGETPDVFELSTPPLTVLRLQKN